MGSGVRRFYFVKDVMTSQCSKRDGKYKLSSRSCDLKLLYNLKIINLAGLFPIVFYLVKLFLSNLGVDRLSGSATLGENEISSALQQNIHFFVGGYVPRCFFLRACIFKVHSPFFLCGNA